jgi:hypothetical protein
MCNARSTKSAAPGGPARTTFFFLRVIVAFEARCLNFPVLVKGRVKKKR